MSEKIANAKFKHGARPTFFLTLTAFLCDYTLFLLQIALFMYYKKTDKHCRFLLGLAGCVCAEKPPVLPIQLTGAKTPL